MCTRVSLHVRAFLGGSNTLEDYYEESVQDDEGYPFCHLMRYFFQRLKHSPS